ncbi:GHKL domain-containing protein [Eubacteriales bacterium OttesenSCG-928-A19]|nr:GHKL domain-containing protein [Eubacteriales bacterium OttesenSCG-928-A19]
MADFFAKLDGYFMVWMLYSFSNFIVFFTMREHMRVSWPMVMAMTLVEGILVYWSVHFLWAGNIIVAVLFSLLICVITDVERYKSAYTIMLSTAYTTVCNLAFFMIWGSSYTWTWGEVWWMLLVYALTAPFMCLLLSKVIWPWLARLSLPNTRWLWVMPAFVVIMDMLVGSSHVQHLLTQYKEISGATSILLVLFAGCVGLMILVIMEKMQATTNYRNDLRMMDMQIASQSRRYTEMLRCMDEIRVMRHDMRHQVRMMTMLLSDGRMEELNAFLRELEQDSRLHDNIIYSHNCISDLVAHQTLHVARDANIDVTVNCGLPKYFWVSDSDLCVLLGNLMENALNACRLQTDGPRRIICTAVVHGEEACVYVENTCGEEALDTPERRKALGLLRSNGYGMASVRTIASKYHGMATFAREDGRFSASVLLNRPKSDTVIPARPEVESEIVSAM